MERILVKKGLASDREIAQAYADHLSLSLYETPAPTFSGDGTEAARVPLDLTLGRLLPGKDVPKATDRPDCQ